MVSFPDALKLGFKNYFTFSGRSTRAELWWWFLFSYIGFMVVSFTFFTGAALVGLLLGFDNVYSIVMFILLVSIPYPISVFIFGIPLLSLSSRRLHDTGRSGWWNLLNFVPFGFIFVGFWWCMRGDSGQNKYGPDPRQATSLSAPAVSSIRAGTAELPMVSFKEAIKLGFNNYVTFSGRATRAEFWWFYLIASIGFYGLLFIFRSLAAGSGTVAIVGIGYVAGILIFSIPMTSLSSRRLHDTGRSGWWNLLNFVPFGVIFMIVWWCIRGDEGPNNYGPDPRQANPAQPNQR